MATGKRVGTFAVEHPRLIAFLIIGITVTLAILAGLPSIWPHKFEPLHSLTIDTDPENMLPAHEPVRIFHNRMKTIMALNDMIVVGIVNEKNETHGVFNPGSLKKIFALTQFAQGLRWRDPDNPARQEGVVEVDMIAPSLVDNVESGGAGVVRFEWLMSQPPETQEAASAVMRKAMDIPFLKGTLVSEDGKALALYLPITAKDLSHRIYSALKQKIENPSRLSVSEIGDFNQVLHQLAKASQGKGPQSLQRIWEILSAETRQHLLGTEKQVDDWKKTLSRQKEVGEKSKASDAVKPELRRLFKERKAAVESLVADLNTWMAQPVSGHWLQSEEKTLKHLNAEGQELIRKGRDRLTPEESYRLKRLWIEAAFAGKVMESPAAQLKGNEEYHITGLPVAEDTFGVLMFKQMAISAPVAMAIIFLLMWFFFRSALVILPAIYDAMIATTATMSLLVITGNTIHIMSSMIPIFIVPIAVLDDVHVISEFFDRYQKTKSRKETIKEVMSGLFTPMLYTTLTTAVGFASLALAPIPPVQVFGLFVAFGVIVAWLCSILLVPAFISVLPQKVLEDFGAKHVSGEADEPATFLGRVLRMTGRGTYRYAKPILAVSMAVLVVSGYGISRIRVNDNPTKWFDEGHPIRIADTVLNQHFGGTYMAYLAFRPQEAPALPLMEGQKPRSPSSQKDSSTTDEEPSLPGGLGGAGGPSLPVGLGGMSEEQPVAKSPEPLSEPSEEKEQIFKDPTTLRWIGALQQYMDQELGGLVGKSNSVTDIVKTVHRELMVGVKRDGHVITEQEAMRVPDSRGGVAQSLLQFQNSHRPRDLWHFVTPDYRTGVVWLQLTSGDNRDMSRVTRGVNDWLKFWKADEVQAKTLVKKHPERMRPVLRFISSYVTQPGSERTQLVKRIEEDPVSSVSPLKKHMQSLAPGHAVRHDWFGLTYINVVWQEKMVKGMLQAFLGSFLAVFLMMTLLYRSALWGMLCMAPLTVTIAMIYGLIGYVGKAYDMPVAILSALSLGLAVDYAIHFLTRSRMMYVDYGSWKETAGPVFGEPARAIARNAIVVGIGFMPLILAPLVPYQTVGIFIAAILLLAGVSTMLILPAAMRLLENKLFPRTRKACMICNRATCGISVLAGIALVWINIRQFMTVTWSTMSWISVVVIIILAGGCALMSREKKPKLKPLHPRKGEPLNLNRRENRNETTLSIRYFDRFRDVFSDGMEFSCDIRTG
ncbi:MAG: MMPL family transporter [Deltaproteobacteria bacterium]|nr:MMPL family transporter [Deltaproteobacteria bacterium]